MSFGRLASRRCHLQQLGMLASILGVPLGAGCIDPQAQVFEEVKRRVLVEDMPPGVTSLAAAHAAFKEGEQVVVVGRIFSSLGSPFDPDTAAFHLIELPKPGHNHDDPGDCPFCKRDMENAANALVQVVDAAGKVLVPSANKLLGLSKNQDVVVVGALTKVVDIMLISSQTLHLLSPEVSLDFARRIHG